MGLNLQIQDGFPIMKVEQTSQGEGFVGVVVDFKCKNKIPTVKVMEQV